MNKIKKIRSNKINLYTITFPDKKCIGTTISTLSIAICENNYYVKVTISKYFMKKKN